MAKAALNPKKQVNGLVDHLRARRETMLNQWRTLCDQDPILDNKAKLSRVEFNDQVPTLLNILAQRLKGEPEESDPVVRAGEHGLHRWQRGYSLIELLTELEYVYQVLLDEIETYQALHKQLQPDVLSAVYQQVFKISSETNRGSLLYYDQLRQTNAAEQANSLQNALDSLLDLSRQRSEHLRQSAHDLRSSFSILTGAAMLLKLPSTEEHREQYVDMLNRNLTSIRDMLLQLTDYARIEAGQETLEVTEFNAADLLQETITLAMPLAEERKLILTADGPQLLPVSGDAVKVQRILQNLLYNALKFTTNGGVYVSWAREDDTRWILSVQDTGPGFSDDSPAGVLAEQLRPVSHPTSTHQVSGPTEYPLQELPSTETRKKLSAAYLKGSEGLGLFIVKKLCEVLKATMDVESAAGQGTLVRIRFLIQQTMNEAPPGLLYRPPIRQKIIFSDEN